MFTGLIQAVGEIAIATPTRTGLRLGVRPLGWGHAPALGDSVSVNGCCLTVARDGPVIEFDAIPETLAKTSLGTLRPGDHVNLEHAATAATFLGGHIVQGHIDGVGVIETIGKGGPAGAATPAEHRVRIVAPQDLALYLVPKGSIAIDGVSLTLAAVDPARGAFEVALIPVTLAATTLGGWRPGQRVNLETDVLAKTIVHYMRHFADLKPGAGNAREE
ncbi:MAG: riboflavin synthase [Phycisphaerales bacterium]|nr:riboflavin synthase [Phycisphaerales bacterium]